jgi:hypothetical protein
LFRKGDKVILKTNLVKKQYYGVLPYFSDLEQHQGDIMTIYKSYVKDGFRIYIVSENNYTWAEEMLNEYLYIGGIKC